MYTAISWNLLNIRQLMWRCSFIQAGIWMYGYQIWSEEFFWQLVLTRPPCHMTAMFCANRTKQRLQTALCKLRGVLSTDQTGRACPSTLFSLYMWSWVHCRECQNPEDFSLAEYILWVCIMHYLKVLQSKPIIAISHVNFYHPVISKCFRAFLSPI